MLLLHEKFQGCYLKMVSALMLTLKKFQKNVLGP